MKVFVNFLDAASNSTKTRVGTLFQIPGTQRIVFEYDPSWAASNLELSPIYLPNHLAGAHSHDNPAFQGLFGLFYDSLPDKWGMQLARLKFEAKGLAWSQVTPLQLLSYRGTRCMGALSFEPDTGDDLKHDQEIIDIQSLSEFSRLIEEGNAQDVLPALEKAGGSAGGMRPKAVIGLNPKSEIILTGVDDLPAGFEHWLVKFDTRPERQYGRVEQAYALMARAAGIDVPQTRLIETTNSKGDVQAHFAVKRFDRIGNNRLHFHSFAGIAHRDFNKLDVDYDEILTLCTSLIQHRDCLAEMFRRIVFNVFAGNGDDHAKNHGFLMLPSGQWQLAPAYDLTWSQPQLGRRATAIMGDNGFAVSKTKLLALARSHEIKDPESIIEQVRAAILRWREYATEAQLSLDSINKYQQRLGALKG